jgi:hypothetical protein
VCSSILSNEGPLRLGSKTRSKSIFSFSMSSKRNSRGGSAHSESEGNARKTNGDMGSSKGSRTSLSSWFRRRGSRSSHASSASVNDVSDCDGDDNAVNAAAVRVSGNKIALEFSNYAYVDVIWRGTRGKKDMHLTTGVTPTSGGAYLARLALSWGNPGTIHSTCIGKMGGRSHLCQSPLRI